MKKLIIVLVFIFSAVSVSAGIIQNAPDGWTIENKHFVKQDTAYWVDRIKNNDKNPLTDEELEKIPDKAWNEVVPTIIQVISGNLLGGGEPQVVDTIICRGNECDDYIPILGFSVATGFKKTLRAGMTSTQNFFYPSDLTLKDGETLTKGDLGEQFFFTHEPGSTREEIDMCTGIDTTNIKVTSCTRGLAFSGTSTSSVSANRKAHNSSTLIVLSNVHYVYEQFVDTNYKTQTISGPKTFASSSIAIGDGSTTDEKCIVWNNGDANSPKICYNETTNYHVVYNDGISSTVLGGTTASTTPGKNLQQILSVMSTLDTMYIPTMNASSTFTSSTMWSGGQLLASSTLAISGAVTSSNIYPWTNNTYDLGSAITSWADIYASGTVYGATIGATGLTTFYGDAAGLTNVPTTGITGATTDFFVIDELTIGDGDSTSTLQGTAAGLTLDRVLFPNGGISTSTWDSITVGAITPGTGAFTTLSSSGLFTPTGGISTSTWDSIDIGLSTAGEAIFTDTTSTIITVTGAGTSTFTGTLQADNATATSSIRNLAVDQIGSLDASASTTLLGNVVIAGDINVVGDIMKGGTDVWKHEYISSETDTGTDTNVINFTVPADTKYALIRYDTKYLQAGAFTVSNIYIDGTTGGSYLSDEAGDAEGGCGINLTWNTTSTPVNIFGNVTSCDSTYKDSRVIIYYYK